MNVFENLIEELKKESLIEKGVIDSGQSNTEKKSASPAVEKTENLSSTENSHLPEKMKSAEAKLPGENLEASLPVNETEFYRRRAIEEVSSLQMVEHIFSGVERDQMKISPNVYDSIAVSTALHEFLQVSTNFRSAENAAAEFKLMEETENWYTALSRRDQNIMPAHLRRFCETTKPVLSAQALAALTRFYRNSPYSEAVRSKFDMVVTRLFSQEKASDERELAFGYNEIIQHLSELYADWASVSLYATDDDSTLSEIVQQFENFIREAESADNFEDLVEKKFFNRLRIYKEKTGENFYAPTVAATVIDCNVRVGNVYVRLLLKEREQANASQLEHKYGFLLDQTISEATSKTLQLTNLLEGKNSAPVEEPEMENLFKEEDVESSTEKQTEKSESHRSGLTEQLLQINKAILAFAVLGILAVSALYFWTQFTEPTPNRQGIEALQLDNYDFKDYLKVAKITNENLIGIVNANWNNLTNEKKQEVLKNMLNIGKEKGFRTVRLQNNEGKTIGYASGENITITN